MFLYNICSMSLYLHNRTFIKQKSSSQIVWKIMVLETTNLAKPDAELWIGERTLKDSKIYTKTNHSLHRNSLNCYCHQIMPTHVLESQFRNPDCTIRCIRIKDASIAYAGKTKRWNIEAYLSKLIAFTSERLNMCNSN